MEEAATYVRKSIVKDDKDESCAVQLRLNRKVAGQREWEIPDHLVFEDDGISASKGLERPAWLRMLEAVKAGKIKRIVVREQARLSREDIELFIFLQVIEREEVEVRDSDWREIKNDLQTKVKALVDADYAKQVAKNVRQKKADSAALGKPPKGGRRTTGYNKDFTAFEPREAEALRRAKDKVLAGESNRSICKYLKEHGYKTSTGSEFLVPNLSKMLLNPTYAGLRAYTPVKNGKQQKELTVITGRGQWQPLWSDDPDEARAIYERLKVKLEKKEAYSLNTARVYLLSGILVCADCHLPMVGRKLSGKRTPAYQCVSDKGRGGCGRTRNQRELDNFITQLVKYDLASRPKHDESAEDPHKVEIEKISKKVDQIREAQGSYEEFEDYLHDLNDARNKLKELRKAQGQNIPIPNDAKEDFDSLSIDKKRSVITQMYGVFQVKPAGKGKRFHPRQLINPRLEKEYPVFVA